jgi:colanic acid biosynthesis glycosyl transferase WcaI
MKIIVWGINYAPEVTGIAPYNTALCEFLAGQGHHVEMVTSFSYYPQWKKSRADSGKLYRTDFIGNVPVHRCWHYVPAKPSAPRRIFHELSFVAASFLRVLFLGGPDVFVVVSPPLLLGAAAWLAGCVKRCPFVFHVQDLQPDAASQLGMVNRKGLFMRALYALEAFSYRAAARVSGIGPGMIEAFRTKGVPEAKLLLFPNGVALPKPGDLPKPGEFRRRMGFAENEFLAVYSGNLGVKHGIEVLIEAAQLLRDWPVRIVICGNGARQAVLAERVKALNAVNVTLLPLQPERAYLEMMVDASAYLVTQQPGSGALFFPSKLLKGLALSKPILVVADEGSELTRAAREGEFAIVADPQRPGELAAAMAHLAKNPNKCKALGEAGRRYVERFELDGLLRAFSASLEELTLKSKSRILPKAGRARPLKPETF